MARRVRAAYEAAQAMGIKCEVCAELLRPNDTGYDVDGGTIWVAKCCGIVRTFIEAAPRV